VPDAWPSLAVVAGLVAAYNVWFSVRLRDDLAAQGRYQELRNCAIRQMVLDLAAVLVTMHFTGGCSSPILAFVVFHMAIGTIMISTRIMYVLGAGTCAAAVSMFAAERFGIIGSHPLVTAAGPAGLPCALATPLLLALVFGVIYLVDTVTSRFKVRSLELHETTRELIASTEELQRSLEARDELQRQKAHYMRISAHQLRSPLGTIKTSLQVMLDGFVDPASEQGRRLLAGTAERVDGLIDIVNDLLELAKMREGRSRAPWTRHVSLSQILADIFDAKDTYARERLVELVPDFISERAVILDWAVPPDLVYAFENLVDNAIKYSRTEGGRVVVRQQVIDGWVAVTVEDNGLGIPEEMLDEVFLEFTRAPNAKRHTSEGTGLGLSVVREAAEMHGGRVEAESSVGTGSRFTVWLPIHHRPPELEHRDLSSGE
jgi:signal transduction histidine kinase